ncbi:Protein of unknown function [Catalinimonas alkaloidigena]|uniref:DUF3078 domain-containing protein n=1 Tax=Catalinimonas alkaloidigena TaxID=1075417 RepID=A0A1G9ED65_9BACT|nr:DUF3078 domain-containing protein [Catalinimonas alkaloidigena]SDK74056.1 Protein of unknown function [Catalinimonas alkaloidigena]
MASKHPLFFLLSFLLLAGALRAQPTQPDTLLPYFLPPVDAQEYDLAGLAPYLVTPPDTFHLWQYGSAFDVDFQQISLSNWAGGGQDAISLRGQMRLFGVMDNGVALWENRLDLVYGITRQEQATGIRKTDDNLQFVSKYGYELKGPWHISAGLDFRTQFSPGYRYPNRDTEVLVSDFLSPGFLLLSLGFEAQQNNFYSMRLSPISGKLTIVRDDSLAARYQVVPGEKVRREIGVQVDGSFQRKILENISFNTRATFFSAFDTFGNVDINWESQLELRVNRYVSSKVTTLLIYDDDLNVPRGDDRPPGPAIQFRESVVVGFSLRL